MDEDNGKPDGSPKPVWLVFWSCAGLLVLHVGMKFYGKNWESGIDSTALGLAFVGLSPWIARIFDSTKLPGVELKFRQINNEVQRQGADIEPLKFIVGHFLGTHELNLLNKLASGERFEIDITRYASEFKAELRHLRALGFIDNYPGNGVRKLYEPNPATTKRDVRDHFYVTKSGWRFLALREEVTGQKGGT
ncbi:MAG TPA: hypothetical protein VL974_06910 [Magnetospirillum sp.]|nr:hypothetical protein [Magnetospirillum sp.]